MAKKEIKQDYGSPRWSMEILDCSMPMTFDTYSVCSYNCLYCFAFFQKSHSMNGYLNKDVKSVDPEKIKKLFTCHLTGRSEELNKMHQQFGPYIKARKVMQWGAMADEFDEFERRYGVTLELLRFFDEIDYPLSLSTKGTWWTEDPRYMDLFAKHAHNWHVKISIISNSDEKARGIELGVPSTTERLAALGRLSDIGIHTTLRLRPFIIGASEGFESLMTRGKAAGVDSVTTEFFCLEARADDRLKERYRRISEVVGYDIYTHYMNSSNQHGYKRLTREMKAPYIAAMRDCAHSLGLRFHVSDAACREWNDAPNCCGVPPEWNSQSNHFGKAVALARQHGEVHFSDIAEGLEELFGGFKWHETAHFNTGNTANRAKFGSATMAEWIRYIWNSPSRGNSPAKMYECLYPAGRDKNGDIIYRYRFKG